MEPCLLYWCWYIYLDLLIKKRPIFDKMLQTVPLLKNYHLCSYDNFLKRIKAAIFSIYFAWIYMLWYNHWNICYDTRGHNRTCVMVFFFKYKKGWKYNTFLFDFCEYLSWNVKKLKNTINVKTNLCFINRISCKSLMR